MCGRYIPNTEDEIMEIRDILSRISIRISQAQLNDLELSSDIYPSQIAPVISLNNGNMKIETSKWGFAKWDNKGIIINAKSETVESSKFFGRFAKNNRCVIPAHGYYEWKIISAKNKQKFEFINNNPSALFMAGLYKQTIDNCEFVILTKKANENLESIHERMPLILKPNQIESWLDGSLNIDDLRKEIYDDIIFKEVI